MAENKKTTTVIRIDAPYISNIVPLLNHGYDVKHTVFYRTSDPSFSGPPKDLFALGHFAESSCSWKDYSARAADANSLAQLAKIFQKPLSTAGYVSYELGYSFEKRWQSLGVPDAGYAYRFLEIDCWYEADHRSLTGAIFAYDDTPNKHLILLKKVLGEWAAKSGAHVDAKTEPVRHSLERIADLGELTFDQYKVQVLQILNDINAGRYYELNFTQRFSATSANSPVKAFQKLFIDYQPSRAFYCDFGSEVIASCSPELFLKKEQSKICTRPIKGSFTAQISSSEKAKLHAEHIMVVDLARNDLGRISDLEWVQVPELGTTSSFGGLSHLESLVAGKTSLELHQILPYTYPAASITGAPKVEVVSAIAQYEKSCRGVYTGACGWKWGSGDFDFNVAIRTFVAKKQADAWKYTAGAGGAIVADSDPIQEYEECLQKAQPLLSELLSNE